MWWWIIGFVVLTYMVLIPAYRGRKRAWLEDMQVAVLAKIMGQPAPPRGQMYGIVHDEHVKLVNLLIDENMGNESPGTFRRELERIGEKSPDKYLIDEYISFYDKNLFPNIRWK